MEQTIAKSVGDKLREARECRGLTIEDIAAEIMVPQHYLKSIEDNQFEALPGQTYAVGFVRNYSKYLNLPACDIVAELKEQANFPKPVDSYEIASGFVSQPRMSVLPGYGSIFAGLCLVAAVYGFWTIAAEGESTAALPPAIPGIDVSKTNQVNVAAEVKPQVVAAAETVADDVSEQEKVAEPVVEESVKVAAVEPAPEPVALEAAKEDVAPVQTAAADVDDVAIHVAEESWIEVRTSDRLFFTGVKQAGDVITVPGETAMDAKMTTGNAGGVWLSVGDWSSSAIGAPGRVRRNLELAPERLLAVLAPAKRS